MKHIEKSDAESNIAVMKRIQKSKKSKEARKVTGNTRLALSVVGALALAGTYALCTSTEDEEAQKPPVNTATVPAKPNHPGQPEINHQEIEKENQRISKIEQAFIKLATTITEKAKKHTDPSMQEEVKIPLKVIQGNQDNDLKTMTEIKRALGKSQSGPIALKQKSTKHFYYVFEQMPKGVGAAYNDVGRHIGLNTKFDTNDLMDMVLLYHELIHTEEDRLRKSRMKTDMPDYAKTLMFWITSNKKTAILDDEVRAHKITLEALNAYFDGELKKLGENATEDNVAELFKKYGKQEKLKKITRVFASMVAAQTKAHYGKDSQPEDLRNLTGHLHQRSGMTLLKMTPTGGVEPLHNNFRAMPKL